MSELKQQTIGVLPSYAVDAKIIIKDVEVPTLQTNQVLVEIEAAKKDPRKFGGWAVLLG